MALIPPFYLNAVASIEIDVKDKEGKPNKQSIATGFLLGTSRNEKDENGKELYSLSFITNRHVYEDPKTGKRLPKVYWRFNTISGMGHYFEINLLKKNGDPIWFKHKNDKVDIAITPVNVVALKSEKIDFYFFYGKDLLFAKDFAKNDISIGDGLFVLGFPVGISGKARNYIIARHGILARVDEEVLNDNFYYIDVSAYPGNSGGPVIHKPEVVSITGTNSNTYAGLMGVVSSGITYSDIAVSQQTQEPRIIFTEQTGLVRAVPIELAIEAIDDFVTKKKTEEVVPKKVNEWAIDSARR